MHVVSYAVQIKQIDIYNLTGQKVYSNKIGVNALKIDINNLESGIYFIEIKSDQSTVKQKFIVN